MFAEPDITQSNSRRLRLAYFSPFNPQPSGISDYSEELLPHLAEQADLDLFVDGVRPTNSKITARFRFIDYRQDPAALERLGDYDAVLYHVGNDHRYHGGIIDALRAHPGIVVFHDYALQNLLIGLARERDDINIYLDELQACHGERTRALASEFIARGAEPPHLSRLAEFPLNCRLARAADGIIVHSKWSRERFASIAPGVPIRHVNHHITSQAAATAIPERTTSDKTRPIQISSFGLIRHGKGIESALRALSALCNDCSFRYTLVGQPDNYFDVQELIRSYKLTDRVEVTGHVALAEFERRILDTDIALNLRDFTVGETSGSLCRIMAAGLPTIVSNTGWFAELPNDCVAKIDNDEHADALLQAYLKRLIEDPTLRQRIGANARRHMLAEHKIQESAAGYISFVREVIAKRARQRLLKGVSEELAQLGVRATDDALLRNVAAEVALLAPTSQFPKRLVQVDGRTASNGNRANHTVAADAGPAVESDSPGRLPKIAGIDYKRAALEYPRVLDAERSYYLRTKPFYNLANKPEKHLGDGMDPETHRHFSDFANMAVALALPPGARILDVGCGSGWLSEYFARLGYEATGIDISDDLIQMARERVARVPYDVDHQTPLHCRFLTQDIEAAPLAEKFDAVICYDSLHHFVDERTVFRHLAGMLDVGGLLFILEGHKPAAGSATEEELQGVMRRFGTLESPYSGDYLRALLDEHGLAVVGDYVSVNGLFEREMLEDHRLPLRSLATDYHYLTSVKVAEGAPASSVPNSRNPGLLRAEVTSRESLPGQIEPNANLSFPITIKNAGDTLWLNGQTVRAGVVMPGVRVFNERGEILSELHGHPLLPRSVVPGQTIALDIQLTAPAQPGMYTVKIDLVAQHVCWFEDRGSQPLVFSFEVGEHSP